MKVSVITVSFNSSATIEKTIRSVQEQQNVHIEHVIIDGGSTDGTVEIIQKRLQAGDVFISEPDEGIYNAMNKGLALASGDIIAILNSDDVFYDINTLETVVTLFEQSSVDMVYSNIMYTESTGKINGKWLSGPYQPKSFTLGWHPPHPGFFCKRHCYEVGGNFDENFSIAADFDLMLRFFEVHGFRSVYLNHFTVKMFSGGLSSKVTSVLRGYHDIKAAFNKNRVRMGHAYFVLRYAKKWLLRLHK